MAEENTKETVPETQDLLDVDDRRMICGILNQMAFIMQIIHNDIGDFRKEVMEKIRQQGRKTHQLVKEIQKLEKKHQEPKISGTHQTKPLVKKGDKKEKKEENREIPGPSTTHKRKLSLTTDKGQKKKQKM